MHVPFASLAALLNMKPLLGQVFATQGCSIIMELLRPCKSVPMSTSLAQPKQSIILKQLAINFPGVITSVCDESCVLQLKVAVFSRASGD